MERHELLQTEPSTLVEMVLKLEQENSKLKQVLNRIDEMTVTGNNSISLNELIDCDKYGQILCSVAQCVGATNDLKAQAVEEATAVVKDFEVNCNGQTCDRAFLGRDLMKHAKQLRQSAEGEE